MKGKNVTYIISLVLIYALLLSSFAAGQILPSKSGSGKQTANTIKTTSLPDYIEDLTDQAAGGQLQFAGGLKEEVKLLDESLSGSGKTGTIIIDRYDNRQRTIVENLAIKMASGKSSQALQTKRILKINFSQLIADSKSEEVIAGRLSSALNYIETSGAILYLDNISNFSREILCSGQRRPS